MINKKISAAVVLCCVLSSASYGLSKTHSQMIHHGLAKAPSSLTQSVMDTNHPDFNGSWVGTCEYKGCSDAQTYTSDMKVDVQYGYASIEKNAEANIIDGEDNVDAQIGSVEHTITSSPAVGAYPASLFTTVSSTNWSSDGQKLITKETSKSHILSDTSTGSDHTYDQTYTLELVGDKLHYSNVAKMSSANGSDDDDTTTCVFSKVADNKIRK